MHIRHGICIISVAFGAGACAPTPIAANACPPIKEYSDAEQQQSAAELLRLPPGSVIGQMIVDYGAERARLRACRGEI